MNNFTNLTTSQKRILFWIVISFTIWWIGVGPSDIFAGFIIIALLDMGIWALKGELAVQVTPLFAFIREWAVRPKVLKGIYLFLGLQVLLWMITLILRYYSFQVYTWDAGLHSNILFNISRGEFYSSFLHVNNLGDHFTPSFSLLALLYKITPSIHWMMLAKWLAFAVTPLIFYRIMLFELKSSIKAYHWSLLLALGWLVLYTPSVNSLRYEFQASSLAPPFIAGAFLAMRQQRWIIFIILMIFLLGFKEHLAVVWIGFGIHRLVKNEKPKSAILMLLLGIIIMYLLMFQLMPYFRDFQPSWSGLERINPFKDIPWKFVYLLKLLLPLGFIPLIFWKNGIIAGPAIGVNLISGSRNMYSGHYHYDDISSTLLFLSLILSIKEWPYKKIKFPSPLPKIGVFLAFLGILALLTFLPRSVPRYLFRAIPNGEHLRLNEELQTFNKRFPHENFIVQDVLGPHLLRRNIRAFIQQGADNCLQSLDKLDSVQAIDFVLLSPLVSPYQIKDLPKCIDLLNQSKQYDLINDSSQLLIFKKVTSL